VIEIGAAAISPGQVASYAISEALPQWRRTYAALVAYDTRGVESAFSNEIVLAPTGRRGPSDGVPEDGDGSGVVSDRPCPSGVTQGCDDNCPVMPNGPVVGTCIDGDPARRGLVCSADAHCGTGGFCSMDQEDSDGDGVGDACENCMDAWNPNQSDSDRDGFGNACDGDFDGDGLVSDADGAQLASRLGLARGDAGFDPDVDMIRNNRIDAVDGEAFADSLGLAPGPSNLACAGETPCREGACAFGTRDSDGDAIGDECDVCILVPNPLQLDTDGDGIGNACDAVEG
jgi:hypothetical protein